MIDDKTEDSPKILLAAGGERGVVRILDVNKKSQHTAVRKDDELLNNSCSSSFYKLVLLII
jgi:hypothetical protein